MRMGVFDRISPVVSVLSPHATERAAIPLARLSFCIPPRKGVGLLVLDLRGEGSRSRSQA
jgi:hypothetical protein